MKAAVQQYRVPVRSAAPQAIALARGLAWLYGKAVNGSPGNNGQILYGYPGLQTNRTSYKGYANPPQLFVGYDPAKVAAGLVRPDPAAYPGESMSPATADSPLARAMATATFGIPG